MAKHIGPIQHKHKNNNVVKRSVPQKCDNARELCLHFHLLLLVLK